MHRTSIGWVIFLTLIGVPLIEIALFIVVGREIGLWPTIALVIGTAVAGSLLIRVQGLAVLEQARQQLDCGEPPVANLFHALGIVVAGILLLTPGFLTDTLGFLLLVPVVRTWLGGLIWKRVQVVRAGTGDGPRAPGDDVIDGEFTRVDEPAPVKSRDRRIGGPKSPSPWRKD